MDSHVRIFRDNPFTWAEKPILRYLRKKYGSSQMDSNGQPVRGRKMFVYIRAVYLALCEIESDFTDAPIGFFTKTVGTYAGVSREMAGECIRILVAEGLISKTRVKDSKTNKFITGTIVHIKSSKSVPTISDPVPDITSNGSSQQRLEPTKAISGKYKNVAAYKKLSNLKKQSLFNNVSEEKKEKAQYYANLIAEKLQDSRSLTFYKVACLRHDPQKLLEKAQEIAADKVAKKPGAVFVSWLKTI